MKKLFAVLLAVVIVSASPIHASSSNRLSACIETILGLGVTGVSYSLFNDTQRNIVLQGAQHIYSQAGFGSALAQIRTHVQKAIGQITAQGFSDIVEIEKIVYLVCLIIGAGMAADGIHDYLTAE